MKTIKIIDLLVKIANNEKVPNKIRYNGEEYILNYAKTYVNSKTSKYLLGGRYNNLCLNDEVEIIEEIEKPKKIKEINFMTAETQKEKKE